MKFMKQKKSPNVIWILTDQMRAQAMSHRGDPNFPHRIWIVWLTKGTDLHKRYRVHRYVPRSADVF